MSVAGFPHRNRGCGLFAGAAVDRPQYAGAVRRAPDNVLRDFWAHCGWHPARRLGDRLGLSALGWALATHSGLSGQVDVVAGLDDPIVPHNGGNGVRGRDIAWRPGGHLLPLTDAAYLAARIREAWREIAR